MCPCILPFLHPQTTSFPCNHGATCTARGEERQTWVRLDSSWVGSDNWVEKKGSQEENSSGLQSRMAFLTLPSARRILGRDCRPAAAGFKGPSDLKTADRPARDVSGWRGNVSAWVRCGDGVKPKASTRQLHNAGMTGGCDWEFQGSRQGFPLSHRLWERGIWCATRGRN